MSRMPLPQVVSQQKIDARSEVVINTTDIISSASHCAAFGFILLKSKLFEMHNKKMTFIQFCNNYTHFACSYDWYIDIDRTKLICLAPAMIRLYGQINFLVIMELNLV